LLFFFFLPYMAVWRRVLSVFCPHPLRVLSVICVVSSFLCSSPSLACLRVSYLCVSVVFAPLSTLLPLLLLPLKFLGGHSLLSFGVGQFRLRRSAWRA
jgi:hypothetical protein